MAVNKEKAKKILFQKLKLNNCFWSYEKKSVNQISDNLLIEMTMQYLDLADIDILFSLFPYEKIKKCWLDQLVPQGDYMFTLNKFFAWYYFHAKKPGSYVRAMATRHLNNIAL